MVEAFVVVEAWQFINFSPCGFLNQIRRSRKKLRMLNFEDYVNTDQTQVSLTELDTYYIKTLLSH